MKSKSRIRYAVIGLGHIAQNAVLPAFQNTRNSELAALITGEREKAEELAKKYGVPAYGYDRFETALSDEAVDAVFICLPNTMHREYTERAAALGRHVLCEKPMATTETDCKAMIEACAHADVRLMIAYRLHFTDAHLRAIALAEEGGLGELRYFNSLFAMQVAGGNIRVRAETGGGPLHDIGIYCLNASRYLFQSEPLEVLAASSIGRDERFQEVEEMAAAILRYPGDRFATFTCSFGSADMDQLDLVGTKGALHMEPAYEYQGELKWRLTRDGKMEGVTFPAGDQFAGEIIYFSGCILDGRQPEPSGLEGLADVRIIHAIEEAARTGRRVTISPIEKPHASEEQEIKRPPVKKPETVGVSSPHRD